MTDAFRQIFGKDCSHNQIIFSIKYLTKIILKWNFWPQRFKVHPSFNKE